MSISAGVPVVSEAVRFRSASGMELEPEISEARSPGVETGIGYGVTVGG